MRSKGVTLDHIFLTYLDRIATFYSIKVRRSSNSTKSYWSTKDLSGTYLISMETWKTGQISDSGRGNANSYFTSPFAPKI